MRRATSHRSYLGSGLIACALILGGSSSAASAATSKCDKVDQRGYAIQQNLHASQVLVDCGLVPGGDPSVTYGSSAASGASTGPGNFVGPTDLNLITGTETLPNVTQSESMIGVNGNDVAVSYNDSRSAPSNQFSGISISHDGGATFARLTPSPFATGHGFNFGDPIIAFNKKLSTWFAGDLATGCGGQGVGLWTSTNLNTWSTGACAVTGSDADRESMWVDNDPSSPFFGRMYVSWNDFALGGALRVTHSDNGTTWTAPVTLIGGFRRNVQVTAGPDGTVFVAALNENGGGVGNTGQQNMMFKSTTGGVSFNTPASATIPGTFTIAGNTACSSNTYFPKIQPIWRQTGYGIPGVGPGGVVSYDFAAHGSGSDEADVFYIRSTDNGATWSSPMKLNTDSSGKEQWMPSLSVTPSGVVVASWYDRRNTTNGTNYQRFIRISVDNGATWGPDQAATTIIPQPNQPDPNVQSCYAGDYNYPISTDTTVFDSWTDGRVSISPNGPQQNVFASAIQTSSLNPTLTVSTTGTGTGTITGPGISCPGDCTEKYTDGASVTLSATAGANSTFVGFGGDCSGTSCSLTMDGDKAVSAEFSANVAPATAPETEITKAKLNKNAGKASFTFAATGNVTGFECALKKPKKHKKAALSAKVKFKTCKSPKKYKHLKPGKYKFSVRATGPGGTDPTPAKDKFKIPA